VHVFYTIVSPFFPFLLVIAVSVVLRFTASDYPFGIFNLLQQVVGIPMGTNCAPLLADLFVYSYESEFLQKLVQDKKIHEARAFNFTYRYIDDVLSINNSRFAEFLTLIYPPELEVKETTDTASSASFLDLYRI
jgi:hypothetical protein